MTTTTPKTLIESKYAEAVLTKQYTATNCKTSIDKFSIVNATAINATFTAYIVPAGGAPDLTNRLAPITLGANKGLSIPDAVGHIMEAGDELWTLAGAVSSINMRASGREIIG